jgi:hypothetical protein
MADEKAAQFQEMNRRAWNSTIVQELTRGSNLFVTSIKWNRDESNAPKADQFQRYNYVVQGDKIFVAVWTTDEAQDVCNSGLPPFARIKVKKSIMVNFYPEKTTDKPTDTRECILDDGETGVLDASSKHFMIAQGPTSTIKTYDAMTWSKTTVDYAGEILVTVAKSKCFYTINQGSGTYRPRAGVRFQGFRYLDKVAALFAHKIDDVYPEYKWDTVSDLEKPSDGKQTVTLNC